ncbi:isochorismate synthase [Salsipaludibacter albus]|uniref:isochorismate synthase n=1 Tax=Salsipaludibacter albus TaxID=2849650 RepID=UPI001EE3E47A|nr:isochorismate synthase [Salsipaludibacter albus]MBY5161065.1 isochorismate synthase [Salsipaludibacter albus]
MTLRIATREVDDPRSLPELLPDPSGALALRRGEGLAAWGRAATITVGTGPQRATRLASTLAGLDVEGDVDELVVLASLTFDRRRAGSRAFVPRRLLRRRDGRTRLVTIDPVDDPGPEPPAPGTGTAPRPHADRLRYAGSSLPDLRWLEAVDLAVERIDAGAAEKVVLARDLALWCEDPFDPRHLADRLATTFPDCWTFLHDGLLGATPELLARREGDAVTSLVLAGTRGRDADPARDARLAEELLGSAKDRHEHQLAVTSVTERLDDLATEVHAPTDPSVLTLDNVHHLATRVTARLADRSPASGSASPRPTAFEVADHLHPTAAVGGTPREAALAMIDDLEGMDRGRYAGPVGWMDAAGDGEVALALRCARLSGARARLFAGVGLVAGSLPEDELEETRLKLLAMQGALGGGDAG